MEKEQGHTTEIAEYAARVVQESRELKNHSLIKEGAGVVSRLQVLSLFFAELPGIWNKAYTDITKYAAFHALIGSSIESDEHNTIVTHTDLEGEASILDSLQACRACLDELLQSGEQIQSIEHLRMVTTETIRERLGLDS